MYFSVVFIPIEKIHQSISQSIKTVFDHISRHLKGCQKYTAVCCIFNSLLGVSKFGQTQSFVFDIRVMYMYTMLLGHWLMAACETLYISHHGN